MAAEYTANALQTVGPGQNFLFTETAVACKRGLIFHRDGSGIATVSGRRRCSCAPAAVYDVTFGANIAIPEGGTVEPISIAIAVNGEVLPTSSAIVTPTAAGDFWNVKVDADVEVPPICGCLNISIENTSGQPIEGQNANIKINRTNY